MSDKDDKKKETKGKPESAGKKEVEQGYGYYSYSSSGKHASDYWRSRYDYDDDDWYGTGTYYYGGSGKKSSWNPATDEEKTKYYLDKCLYDVSRIVNIFDSSVMLTYRGADPEHEKNDTSKNVIVLDPNLAADEKRELGAKIDVYAGEILLGTALRKQARTCDRKTNYNIHTSIAKTGPTLKSKLISTMYLAMETYKSLEYIEDETPGFIPYCRTRAHETIKNYEKADAFLKEEFLNESGASNPAKLIAMIREIDTFNSGPIEEYDESFEAEILNLLQEVGEQPRAIDRLNLATSLVNRYLADEEDEEDALKQAMEGAGDPGDGMELLPSKEAFGGEWNEEIGQGVLDMYAKMAEMEGADGDLKPKRMDEIANNVILEGAVRKVSITAFDVNQDFFKKARGAYYYERRVGDHQRIYTKYSSETFSITEEIKERLDFMQTNKLSWEEYSLRSGELDEGGLHKLTENSDRLFYRMETFTKPKIQIALLVDESGSMHGNRIRSAAKTAIAIANALKDINGIDLYVYGHSGNALAPDGSVFRYVNPDSDDDQYEVLGGIFAKAQNYDSYAIKFIGEEILESSKEYHRRIIFSISDGQPAGNGYGGLEAQTHLRSVCDYLKGLGVEVYAIGVDNAYSQQLGEKMYGQGNNVVLPNFDISKVSGIIGNFLEEVSRSN